MTRKYIMLSINGLATLLPICFGVEHPLVFLWSWTIWGLIYYEFINSVEKIYYYDLRKSSKWILQVNLFMQFTFVVVYSNLLRSERKTIVYAAILFGIQIIKIITSLEKDNLGNKKDVNDNKNFPTVDELVACAKLYFSKPKIKCNHAEEKVLFIQTTTAIVWGIFGIFVADLAIELAHDKSVNFLCLIIYLVGVLCFSYRLYDFTVEKYRAYFITVCGQILTFIIFNNVFEFKIFQNLGEWVKIYYSVFFFTPCVLKINGIMQRYKK